MLDCCQTISPQSCSIFTFISNGSTQVHLNEEAGYKRARPGRKQCIYHIRHMSQYGCITKIREFTATAYGASYFTQTQYRANLRWRHSANNKESARHARDTFLKAPVRKKMATLNEQRKKRARLGFRYAMELNFAGEESKKVFLSRVESAKPRLAPRGSPLLDSRELLSSLLDMAEATPRSSTCYHVH